MAIFASSEDRCKDTNAFLFKCRLSELTFRILSELTFRIAPQLRFEHFLSLSNLDQSLGGSPVIVSPNAWGSATRGVIEARPFLVHACSLAPCSGSPRRSWPSYTGDVPCLADWARNSKAFCRPA